jgi:hypothetical protein
MQMKTKTLIIAGLLLAITTGTAFAGNYVTQGGLTWKPVDSTKLNWEDANDFCTTRSFNGQTGWRLPKKYELTMLYESGAMKDQGWTLNGTWSSTPDGSGGHYNVYLYGGYVVSSNDTGSGYVTCVR